MHPNYVDPEEMSMRKDLDVIASLNMIGEGGPSYILEKDTEEKKKTAEPTDSNTP